MFNKCVEVDEWRLIEREFSVENHPRAESLFSIGNGRMGQRANFEETYTGPHLQGSYVAGVYYPDKTKVGWWKNGYPEYFAKVLNSVNWIGIDIEVEGEKVDLFTNKVNSFYRELNMQEGYLYRSFEVEMSNGRRLKGEVKRFVSLTQDEIGAIEYKFTPMNFSGVITVEPYLDFDVVNHDSNYDEKFWEEVSKRVGSQKGVICAKTKKLDFQVAAAMRYDAYDNGRHLTLYPEEIKREKYLSNKIEIRATEGHEYAIYKYAAILSSLNHRPEDLVAKADDGASDAMRIGFEALLEDQKKAWAHKWEQSDIIIEGDEEAQQGIRFNIFHLQQTYTGEDARLNIGPKGFTGEKYGGSTYWDTEAYCLPFYLASADADVAKNLLLYRHKQLDKAIENAEKLGFTNGAALYPMVTMNGEECHNEWEITFEEIHRNGAIAYGIYNYIRHTLDYSYLLPHGMEVLFGISRFWAQRVNWSAAKKQYVMLGVTGPNEYENNINNNWYTNYIAAWCMRYTLECLDYLQANDSEGLAQWGKEFGYSEEELAKWRDIIDKMYYPEHPEMEGVVLQQEGFLDKELIPADELPNEQRPINQTWSWDRILRSCYIKQADVLQGFYFFEDEFSLEQTKANFDFYEPLTVHESSLSPCVHSILAARLGMEEKAYEMYLRTSRLDLDDYNREVHEGLHITSMAGTWMSVVQGFGGMRIVDFDLEFAPALPKEWDSISFKIIWRGNPLHLNMTNQKVEVENLSSDAVDLIVFGEKHSIAAQSTQVLTA